MAGINLHLSVSPIYQNPRYSYELQSVYNSLHTLNAYAGALKNAIGNGGGNSEVVDGEDPNISLPFVTSFWATALQAITPGAIISNLNGGMVNGVLSSEPFPVFVDSGSTIGSTGSRRLLGVVPLEFFIAITAAAPGEKVQVGVGPGITKVNGAKCGKIIWAVDSRSIYSERRANTVDQIVRRRDILNNGGLYLNNIIGRYAFASGGGYNWEGFWTQSPGHSGNQYTYNRAYLYPVGICIKDDYVLFSDYKRSDPLPDVFFT